MSIDDLPNYIDEYFQPEWNWKRKDISTEMLESEMADLLFNNVEKAKLSGLLTPGQGTRTGRKIIINDFGCSSASISSEQDLLVLQLPDNLQKALSFQAHMALPDADDEEGTLYLIDFKPRCIGLFCGNFGTKDAYLEIENNYSYNTNAYGLGHAQIAHNQESISLPIFCRWLPIPSCITATPFKMSKHPKDVHDRILGCARHYRTLLKGTTANSMAPNFRMPKDIHFEYCNYRGQAPFSEAFALRNLLNIWEDYLTYFYSRIGGYTNELYKLINSKYTSDYIIYRLGGQSEFGNGRRIHPDLFFSQENNPFDFYETKTKDNPWLHLPDDSGKTNGYVRFFGSHLSLRFFDLTHRTEDNPFLFDFKNDKGYTTLKLLKWVDYDENCYHVVPVQCWQLGNTSHNAVYATYNYSEDTPIEKRLPIYNLDLITAMRKKADDESDYHGKIVLTDSVAVAEHLQCCLSPEDARRLIFTSFICIGKQYNQINWLPLKHASERGNIKIDLLITNHSGFSIEEAVVRANDLASYLTKEYDIKINAYWGKEIDYSSNEDNRKNIDPAFSYMPHPAGIHDRMSCSMCVMFAYFAIVVIPTPNFTSLSNVTFTVSVVVPR